jgi:hypothetical protein
LPEVAFLLALPQHLPTLTKTRLCARLLGLLTVIASLLLVASYASNG